MLPETSKTHLAKMQNRIGRMEKFLDDLLTYSRVGRYYYQRAEMVDTGGLLKEIIDSLAPPPGFIITLQPEMPVLRAQRILLEIVFKNLLDNALKHHHRPEGHLQISARELDSFIEFSITDDGPGIDPMFHERIFQIFQTLRPRDELEATGAGLAIVKKAVESQGGAIQVFSAEGQGATFRFTWPKNSDIKD
jgi:signal transduction histidine kinase